ncbi:glucosaminidase domain-containing protein [Evansella sp. AB-P1]|uniref:N-acetylglucosaminidase n=1 Tax=Evansella sp. AB-P1 TaxID=3037653 RepID=UPI00241C74CA|nr:glucosaminidase domain-containing protein [Evansella sp. AB-P1]MDG5786697.1 glucosaminidase domain-containing protein [Evansella sp. AB-P1]
MKKLVISLLLFSSIFPHSVFSEGSNSGVEDEHNEEVVLSAEEVDLEDIEYEYEEELRSEKAFENEEEDHSRIDEKSNTESTTFSEEMMATFQVSSSNSEVRDADSWIQYAASLNTASKRLEEYIKGYDVYPNDERFKSGINQSANSLLHWAIGQHDEGNFETAIERYETILSAPALTQSIKQKAESRLVEAKQGKRPADILYTLARNGSTASERLALYSEGYRFYPNDSRFESGINSSANSLLSWAKGQHDAGNFETAIERYETILSAPTLSQGITQETESKLSAAKQGKRSANVLYAQAKNGSTASERLALYSEGYRFYPNDSRFESGINSSANSLLSWAKGQHDAGNFETAIERYETILSAPALIQSTKQETESRLADAKQGKRPANVLYNLARNGSTASERLTLYSEGNKFYPNDSRFTTGLNNSAQSLLNWATKRHDEGEYTTAIERYKFILSAPVLSNSIKQETVYKLEQAEQELRTPDGLYDLAQSQSTASERLALFIEGNEEFPNDNRFVSGINSSARSLLDWATRQHNNSQFETAIERYITILAVSQLDDMLKRETEVKLVYAEQGKRIPTSNELFTKANNQSTASNRLPVFIEGYILYPSDKRFENGINATAQSLLNWSVDQHRLGNFETVIDRYSTIIGSFGVQNSIKADARHYLSLAEKGLTPSNELIEFTEYNTSLSDALNVQMGIRNPPPQTDKYRNANVFIHSSLIDIEERGVITGDPVNLRKEPNLTSDFVQVSRGTSVIIEDEVTGSEWNGSNKWYKIKHNGETRYVHTNLADVKEVAFVKSTANIRKHATTNSHSFGSVSANTELEVVRRLEGSSVGNDGHIWYELKFNRTWRNAPEADVLQSLDPDNNNRFQHLVLSESVGVPVNQLNSMVAGRGILDGLGKAFSDGAKQHSVNEVYLIAHAILETAHGTSTLAKGVYVDANGNPIRNSNGSLVTDSSKLPSDAVKVYNMFGIAAFDNSPLNGGARYAFQQGWTTPEKAVIGGAKWISDRYVNKSSNPQNTIYKMRWNPASAGTNQYATDIGWATKQAVRMEQLYDQIEIFPMLHFDIPVYK